jgi:hypothetical protein
MSLDYKTTTIEQLIAIMFNVLKGDTDSIQSASAFLKMYIKHI